MALVVPILPRSAIAHPLGNDNVEHFSILYVLPDHFEVDYVLDINETPAGIMRREEIDANHDDDDTVEEQNAWLERKARDFASLLHVKLDEEPMALEPMAECFDPRTGAKAQACRMVIKMAGFGGMPTYRLLIRYGGKYPHALGAGDHRIFYADETFTDIPGMRRILLEETTLALIPKVKFDDLRPGPLSPALLAAIAEKKLPISPKAQLKPFSPSQYLLLDAGQCLALEEIDVGLGLFRSPYIAIGIPRPSYWNEGIDPFNYQQYDPSELPQEKTATVRFVLRSPCPAAPASATASAAVVAASTSKPAVPADGHPVPAFIDNLNAPHNNPAQAEISYRRADTLVGKLQQLRKGGGLALFLGITLLAFSWGAGHALMPGHAKTVVAAYLISQRGTYWHAVILAFIVTITHTALVVIVGVVIYLYQKTHPNLGPTLQLWLGILAGILVAIMGLTLVWRALTGRIIHHDHDHHHDHEPQSWWRKLFTHSHPHVPGHTHQHHGHDHGHTHTHDHGHSHSHAHDQDHTHAHGEHDHSHHHHAHSHDHEHAHEHGHTHDHHHPAAQPISTGMLLMLGITGGIVPCPTAMIILLLGIGANVVAWALYAVGVFSLGLALTLMCIGFFALASRRFATRLLSDAEHEGELTTTGQRVMFQLIPALSGMVVIVLGLVISANYLYALRVGRPLIPWLG